MLRSVHLPAELGRRAFTPNFPLFPDQEGKVCEKVAVVDTLRAAAVKLGVPLESVDGSEAVRFKWPPPEESQVKGRL